MIEHCETIAARNAQGETVEAGAEWNEARPMTEAAIHKIGEWTFYASDITFAIGIGASLLAGKPSLLLPCGVGLFGLAWGLGRLGWRVPGTVRALVFGVDGGINLSNASAERRQRLRLPHSEIASIEAEQVVFPKGEDPTPYTHGVRIFFRNGQVVHIAKNIEPDHAHMIAVRLSQALSGLREELAVAAMGTGTVTQMGARAKPREFERVID